MARSQEEFRTHVFVADVLRKFAKPEIIWTHPANGEYRPAATGARLKRMGVQKGVPDFILVRPGGQAAFLEIKSGVGRLSPEQKAFQSRAIALGCEYGVARKGEDAITLLALWGLLQPGYSRLIARAAA